jgi:hypothetical protein
MPSSTFRKRRWLVTGRTKRCSEGALPWELANSVGLLRFHNHPPSAAGVPCGPSGGLVLADAALMHQAKDEDDHRSRSWSHLVRFLRRQSCSPGLTIG